MPFLEALATLGLREIWVREKWAQEVWRLVLSFFGGLILRMPGWQGLELGRDSLSKTITSWAVLNHLSENGSLKAINRFFATNASQLSYFLLHYSIWALTRGLSSFQINRISLDSFGAPSASNLITEILEVRYPIVNFYLLILGVLSNAPLDGIHGSSWVIQTLSKGNLKLNSRQGALKFVLIVMKANPCHEETKLQIWYGWC